MRGKTLTTGYRARPRLRHGRFMVGNALDISWYSIRNASDPQIPNPNNDIKEASRHAAEIYASYGGLTTATSLVATWAVNQSAQARRARRARNPRRSGATRQIRPRPKVLGPRPWAMRRPQP